MKFDMFPIAVKLPEVEAELVAGYNVEYSAMGFALFVFLKSKNNKLISIRY